MTYDINLALLREVVVHGLIPDWLIFDQPGGRKMAGCLKNLMTEKWSALSIYPKLFLFFGNALQWFGCIDRLDHGHPT